MVWGPKNHENNGKNTSKINAFFVGVFLSILMGVGAYFGKGLGGFLAFFGSLLAIFFDVCISISLQKSSRRLLGLDLVQFFMIWRPILALFWHYFDKISIPNVLTTSLSEYNLENLFQTLYIINFDLSFSNLIALTVFSKR